MRAAVALIGFLTLVLGANCAAQTRSSHDVTITVPALLRLRIDDGQPVADAWVPLAVDVANGVARIAPDHTRLLILANTQWQVTATFAPDAGSERLVLGFAVEGAATVWSRTRSPQIVLRGAATGGWRERTVRYALAEVPADGRYGGVITYTLSRP